MGQDYALSLLAHPPQSIAPEDMREALYPSLTACVERLLGRAASNKPLLDVAVRLTRLVDECEAQAELFARTKEMVAGVYGLLASVLEEARPVMGRHDARGLEARVTLIHEANIAASRFPLPPAVREFRAFAASGRPRTRVSHVGSPQGDDMYRKFRLLAKNSVPTATLDHADRLPGGMQMFNPMAVGRERMPTTIGNYSPRVIVGLEGGRLGLSDKSRLTMELMALSPSNVDELTDGRAMPSSLHVVVRSGEHVPVADTRNFLPAAPEDGQLLRQKQGGLQPGPKTTSGRACFAVMFVS
ncbi:uncharacterized protein MAM_06347 [Metarhizium album ARSEF 1941]|uniref:Uncharacterized protein n=1 Tax=Metarhizium album (strain ARSEF 1941) TaxID=1081103 RepID=A0A0B2WS02_METAS|nr:uncharacterized protein MAM_06347 [Metarhizium album ARSEF 1941]KHN95735.1 hypothetical protein MAM_06347 [Metarhizium album ARSEF 1941]